ncbi:MAG TPA: dihydroorotate dehydrogenase electron transfer subunit [Pseudogracilibacillus sp.]|nr:dihydroorotate dehydrogenase electron transfer subunit [Pseudogracilibacillus sp.]
MKKQRATIVSSAEIAKETIAIVLKDEYISQNAKPGQFVHICIDGFTLRRPISIAHIDEATNTFTILFKVIGDGTGKLASYQAGQSLDLLGPNGSGFPLKDINKESSILLLGGGIGVPPIYFLAKKLNQLQIPFQAILGFQTKDYVFYEDEFKKLGATTIVTDDGTYGKKGFVTDYVEKQSLDRYYACGPLPMLRSVKRTLSEIEGYLSFEERMACGIGACYACVIPTKGATSYKKICQDGPVLAAKEVDL